MAGGFPFEAGREWLPPIDLAQSDGKLTVRADLPRPCGTNNTRLKEFKGAYLFGLNIATIGDIDENRPAATCMPVFAAPLNPASG